MKSQMMTLVAGLLLLSQQYSYADCQRSVYYEILTETAYALPVGSDPRELNILDVLKAKNERVHQSIEICVDEQNRFSMTTINLIPPEDNSVRQFAIWKTVVDHSGVHLYNFEEELLDFEQVETETYLDSIGYLLPVEEITEMGLIPVFSDLSNNVLQDLDANGFTAWINNNSLISQGNGKEWILNSSYPYTVEKTFVGDSLISSVTKEFTTVSSDYLAPTKVIERSYTAISTGTLLQEKKVTTYLSYAVMNEEEVLVSYQNDDFVVANTSQQSIPNNAIQIGSYTKESWSTPSVQIYPNPAQEVLNVVLPKGHTTTTLTIRNLHGQVIQSHFIGETEEAVLPIGELPTGVYLLEMGENYTTRFVKN